MQRSTDIDIQGNFDPNFDRKLDLITAGLHDYLKEHLLTKIT